MSAQLERNWQTSRMCFAVIMLVVGGLSGLSRSARHDLPGPSATAPAI